MMNKVKRIKKSLLVIIIKYFSLLAFAVISLAAFLAYSGNQITHSLQIQKELDVQHDTDIDLKEAIDNLVYFSAEMSNSLSDQSLDNFEEASRKANTLIHETGNPEFISALLEQKEIIEQEALSALDAYIVDDRALGDNHMANVRASADKLKTAMKKLVSDNREKRNQQRDLIEQRTKFTKNIAILISAIAVIMLLVSAIFMWKSLFLPIRRLINSLTNAAINTSNSHLYRMQALPDNELGTAGHALNHLLKAVTSSIAKADHRAKEAQSAQLRWQTLFDGSPDAIIILDSETSEILDHNSATRDLLCMGTNTNTNSAKQYGFDIHHHELDYFKEFINQIKSNGFSRSDTLSCAVGDKRIPVSVVGIKASHEDDKAILMHVRDISEQHRHEAALNEARIESEKANEAKSNFLANMSHEIRTPMNGIIGMSEVLESTELSGKQRKFLNIISSSSEALLSVINDILEVSKIEANQIKFESQSFNLRSIAENTLSMMVATAEEKKIELILRYDPSLPNLYIGDEGRLRQVLINLIGNAVKFTQKGYVEINISGKRIDNKVNLCIRIEDTGIGIPEFELDRIFDKFNQVDNSATRKYEGTGLGLAISRMLAERMGGNITVQSVLGEGSQFSIEIELPIAAEEKNSQKNIADIQGIRALIVTDKDRIREVLSEQFRYWGLFVTQCTSPTQALSTLRHHNSEHFDIIIADHDMTPMDGRLFLKKIESENLSGGATTILLSSLRDEKIYNANEDDFVDITLLKPVFSDELNMAILTSRNELNIGSLKTMSTIPAEKVIEANSCNQENSCDRAKQGKSQKVLIVEDNCVNQMVVSSYLKNLGYEYDIAEDGKQGVEKFIHGQHAIIFMDISMPILNGYEATAEIRESCKHSDHSPIIIGLTANALAGDREKCLEAGMDGYLAKPVKMNQIADEIARLQQTHPQPLEESA